MPGMGQDSGRSASVTLYWFCAFGWTSLAVGCGVGISDLLEDRGGLLHYLRPYLHDPAALVHEFRGVQHVAGAVQRKVMQALPIAPVGADEEIHAGLRHQIA